eukprot:scaffold13264_cov17-Tisochrysis_lutea.AAC.1
MDWLLVVHWLHFMPTDLRLPIQSASKRKHPATWADSPLLGFKGLLVSFVQIQHMHTLPISDIPRKRRSGRCRMTAFTSKSLHFRVRGKVHDLNFF